MFHFHWPHWPSWLRPRHRVRHVVLLISIDAVTVGHKLNLSILYLEANGNPMLVTRQQSQPAMREPKSK